MTADFKYFFCPYELFSVGNNESASMLLAHLTLNQTKKGLQFTSFRLIIENSVICFMFSAGQTTSLG